MFPMTEDGACTSSVGTWVQITAQNWMVLSLTNSAFFLGLDSFLQQLPIMLLTLVPAFGLRALPLAARGVVGLALAAAVAPAVASTSVATPARLPWIALAFEQIVRGLPVAVAAAVPLWAATMAGGLVDTLRGAMTPRQHDRREQQIFRWSVQTREIVPASAWGNQKRYLISSTSRDASSTMILIGARSLPTSTRTS